MNFHQQTVRASYSERLVKRKKPITVFGYSIRELILIVIITFPCMGTFFPFDSYLGAKGLGAIIVKTPLNTTLILTVILSYVFWLYAQNIPKAMVALRRNWIVFLFILWAMVTASYSSEPGASFNRSGRLLVFALYGVYMMEYLPYRRAMQIFLICLSISVIISLFMILAVPSLSYVLDDARGSWRGAMQHKNNLGVTVGICFVASILAFYTRLFDRRFCVAIAFISLILLKLANSATALGAMVVIVSLMAFMIFVVNRSRQPLVVLGTVLLAAAAIVPAVISSGIVFELLNRDASLTGRAEVWEFAHSMIDQSPFWGYGHGVWTTEWFRRLVLAELQWLAPHAHNAWLDFRLQLGLPGFLLAVCLWAMAALNCLRLVNARRVTSVTLPITIFAFLSIRSYSETVICDPSLNDMFWVAFFFAAFSRGAVELKASRLSRAKPQRSRQASSRLPGMRSRPSYVGNIPT